jgi:large subunit ribosomal protein L5
MKLDERYKNEVIPALREKFGFKNIHEVPKITKVVINMGVGEGARDAKVVDMAVVDLTSISGQKPVITKAKKSISNFKLRAGMPVGTMVTLRGARMYDFLSKLINVAIPRIWDFRGVSPRAFDGRGNYTLGVKEQLIFPEVDLDKVERVVGMNITIGTTAKNDEEGYELLRLLGMPFRKN